jgi:predicted GNAT family acetyltransferase
MAELTDNTARHRFEMATDGGTAFVTYVRAGDRLLLTHAEVPHAAEGHGVGSALAHAVLQEIRRRGQRAVPACPFIAAFVERHPEFADVIADGEDTD